MARPMHQEAYEPKEQTINQSSIQIAVKSRNTNTNQDAQMQESREDLQGRYTDSKLIDRREEETEEEQR